MQRGLTFCALLSLAAPAAAAETPKDLDSRITEVTVFADRAQVTRVASVDLPAGATKVSFRKLPGWIDDSSVRLAVSPSDAARIVDVSLEKNFLAEASEADVRKAEAAVREVNDQLAALADETAVLDAEAKEIESIRAFTIDKLPKDMATRDVKVQSFAETVDFVSDRLRKNAAARRAVEAKRQDLQPELAARSRTLVDLQQRSQLEQRTVVVSLDASAAHGAKLSLSYLLPGATWEPVAELRAGSSASSKVTLSSFAIVTQTTGEDWDGAKISLSTQRPTDTLKLPELQGLTVGGSSLATIVGRAGDSFARAQASYSSQNMFLSKGKKEYAENVAQQMIVQQKVTEEFTSLQERGTTAQFPAFGTQTVRADGKPVRLPIGSTDLDATHRILAAPEVSLNAAQTIDLVNQGAAPLLPGTLALYMDGAFLGNTELPFVAQGETFSVFAGTADRIKLARVLDKKHSNLERGGKRTRLQVSFVITAQNLSELPAKIAMADRVPISEVGEIKVSDVRIQPDVRPDEKGLLHWDLALGGKQTQSFRVEYAVEYPTDLLVRLQQQKEMNANNPAAQPAPAEQMMYDDIDRLEIELKK